MRAAEEAPHVESIHFCQNRSYRSSSGCTHLYGVISRNSVSFIMWTGGAQRSLRHDRHCGAASNFQIAYPGDA